MKEIKVMDFIPNAFSSEQALILKRKIEEGLENQREIQIDFEGISKYTTLFFNFSTGYFINKLGKAEYDSRIKVKNLTKLGESAYQNSYDNSVSDKIQKDIEDEIMNILNSQDE